MNVAFRCAANVHNLLDFLRWDVVLSMTQFVLRDLKCLQISILCKRWGSESKVRRRHVNTSDCNSIARGALPSVGASGSDLDSAGDVTDRHLIAGLLDLDILETGEF